MMSVLKRMAESAGPERDWPDGIGSDSDRSAAPSWLKAGARQSLSHAQAERWQIENTFSFFRALRFGLGFGIGLMLAIPIGAFIVIVTALAFGGALAEMPIGY